MANKILTLLLARRQRVLLKCVGIPGVDAGVCLVALVGLPPPHPPCPCNGVALRVVVYLVDGDGAVGGRVGARVHLPVGERAYAYAPIQGGKSHHPWRLEWNCRQCAAPQRRAPIKHRAPSSAPLTQLSGEITRVTCGTAVLLAVPRSPAGDRQALAAALQHPMAAIDRVEQAVGEVLAGASAPRQR